MRIGDAGVGWSVGPTALKGVEEHVAHGADIGLDPGQPVVMAFAVLGALTLDALALGDQLAVEPR